MFSLKDRVALVTGGANGIGTGVVKCLAKAGAKVIICDIDEENGNKIANEVDGDFYYLDVTDQARTEEIVEEVVENYQRLDILVANTGIYPEVLIKDMTEEDWDKTMDVNMKGMFYSVKAALKPMTKQKYGRIILMSSVTGDKVGYPGGAVYGASKAAALGFMRNLAVEVSRDGITVNSIQPGLIATEALKDLGAVAGGEEYIPVGRLGEPEDIGAAAVFFASEEAGYITGQGLVVDGGQILPETPDSLPK